jgi:hypothetical protein
VSLFTDVDKTQLGPSEWTLFAELAHKLNQVNFTRKFAGEALGNGFTPDSETLWFMFQAALVSRDLNLIKTILPHLGETLSFPLAFRVCITALAHQDSEIVWKRFCESSESQERNAGFCALIRFSVGDEDESMLRHVLGEMLSRGISLPIDRFRFPLLLTIERRKWSKTAALLGYLRSSKALTNSFDPILEHFNQNSVSYASISDQVERILEDLISEESLPSVQDYRALLWMDYKLRFLDSRLGSKDEVSDMWLQLYDRYKDSMSSIDFVFVMNTLLLSNRLQDLYSIYNFMKKLNLEFDSSTFPLLFRIAVACQERYDALEYLKRCHEQDYGFSDAEYIRFLRLCLSRQDYLTTKETFGLAKERMKKPLLILKDIWSLAVSRKDVSFLLENAHLLWASQATKDLTSVLNDLEHEENFQIELVLRALPDLKVNCSPVYVSLVDYLTRSNNQTWLSKLLDFLEDSPLGDPDSVQRVRSALQKE